MKKLLALLMALTCLALVGCMNTEESRDDSTKGVNAAVKPVIPEKLETNQDGVPILSVYNIATEKLEKMDLETYVTGVVAGEMRNDWPEEALKAQAILARTYVLKFVQDKTSKYSGADISTDVSEAQAYSTENINDRVKEAVEDTRGEVMSVNGEYPYAWFHAHAGGVTELPSVALAYGDEDPSYLKPVQSPDSEEAPDTVKNWTATFTAQQVAKACADAGVETGTVESIEIGSKGESGRVKEFVVNGKNVSAAELRINIGANELKSTMIDDVMLKDGKITFTGRGFGHGVGMSQWGAYAMAKEGKDAEEIVEHYFQGVDIVELWDD